MADTNWVGGGVWIGSDYNIKIDEMKKLFITLAVGGLFGCDLPMAQDRMKERAYQSIIDSYRCMRIGKIDSAYFYQGQAEAFYEAAYNEPSSPLKTRKGIIVN